MTLLKVRRSGLSIGVIKWYGGQNKRTGKRNDFGFIESIEGDDLFVHARQLDGVHPEEGEFAVFMADFGDPLRPKATHVRVCKEIESYNVETLVAYLRSNENLDRVLGASKYKDFIKKLANRESNEWITQFIDEGLSSSKSVLNALVTLLPIDPFQRRYFSSMSIEALHALDGTLEHVPKWHFDQKHTGWVEWLKQQSTEERESFFELKIDDLPLSFVLLSVFEGLVSSTAALGLHKENVQKFVLEEFDDRYIGIGLSKSIPKNRLATYATEASRNRFSSVEEFFDSPVVRDYAEPPAIKKKVWEKDRSFASDVRMSDALCEDPEFFILRALLPLIWDQNSDAAVEAVFFHRIWQAIEAGTLDVNDPRLLNLFPSCGTLGASLSCEAHYWEKEDLFLCRHRLCREPKVQPELDKSYLEYNIFDWLSYFGCNYTRARHPSKRDFPIKLAGYFNRIKEIRDRLDCRSCGTLMKPDFKYSRVETKVFDPSTGQLKSVQFRAAYRSTVFFCDQGNCGQLGERVYLSHCLGHKCADIVDSRDLARCENGFYVCRCGSCCQEHNHTGRRDPDPPVRGHHASGMRFR